jgi:hypothetical protein
MIDQISWGNVTLIFNHDCFHQGYQRGRRYYFEDALEEDNHPPPLTASSLPGVIAVQDECGHYQLDDGHRISVFRQGVEELLGVLVGSLSGPLHAETPEEQCRRLETNGVIVLEEAEG